MPAMLFEHRRESIAPEGAPTEHRRIVGTVRAMRVERGASAMRYIAGHNPRMAAMPCAPCRRASAMSAAAMPPMA